jgi:hypothetical protein
MQTAPGSPQLPSLRQGGAQKSWPSPSRRQVPPGPQSSVAVQSWQIARSTRVKGAVISGVTG